MPVWDPGAVLRCWPLTVTLLGRDWDIPALTAADWLAAAPALTDNYDAVVPGLLTDPGEAEAVIADAWLSAATLADAPGEEVAQVARDAIVAAAGVGPWWVAERLMWIATQPDGLGGELVSRGVVFDRAPLGAVVAGVWRIIQALPDDKGARSRLLHEIETPPPGHEQEFTMSAEEFMAAER